MPIFGLTDRKGGSFKEIGRLRKGAPKSEGLQDLKYFRPDFRPDETEALARFIDAYGPQPTRINIRLAFDDIERCWECWFMVYNTAGLMGKAGLVPGREGWWWIYFRNPKTGELTVKDGTPETPFDPKTPVYSYRNKKNQDVPVYARPEGRLKVLVPELRMINYVTLMTHSWYDCARIDEQLTGIQEIAKRMGMSLPLVPLVLSRRPETVSIAWDGHKKMETKWLVNIDVRSDWGEAQFMALEQIVPGKALPAPVSGLPELPAGVADSEWSEEDEAEDDVQEILDVADLAEAAGQTETQQKTEQPAANGARPCSPADLLKRMQTAAKRAEDEHWTINDKQRNMLAPNLEGLFAGDPNREEKRRTLTTFLFEKAHVGELSTAQAVALKSWMNYKPSPEGEWIPDLLAVKEAQAVVSAAAVAEGQQYLF